MKRKINQTILSESVFFAFLMILYCFQNIWGQTSNIIDKNSLNNNYLALNLNNFQTETSNSNQSPNSLNDPLKLNIKIPDSPSLIIKRKEFPIPFNLSTKNESNPPVDIELLYANVQNPVWMLYGKILKESSEKAFLFKAPQNGEFAFVLRTNFKDGSSQLSSVIKINIMSDISEDVNQIDNNLKNSLSKLDSNVLTNKESNSSEALKFNLNLTGLNDQLKSNGSQSSDTNINSEMASENSENNDENNAPFPGQISEISYRTDPNKGTFILVRWKRPQDLGLDDEETGGFVQLERAQSLNGPWNVVANQLDCKSEGYFWKATPFDATPFYLRTVTTDNYGKEWIDVCNKQIDFSSVLKNEPEISDSSNNNATVDENDKLSKITNVGLSQISLPQDDEESERPQNIRAWLGSPDIPTPGNDQTPDSLSNNPDSVDASKNNEQTLVSQTSSVSSENEKTQRKLFDINFSQKPQQTRPVIPPPTNPSHFSVNPLFTQGLGVIFQAQQARNPNGYLENPTANNYYAQQQPTNDRWESQPVNQQASQQSPERPKRRSIFALFNRQQERSSIVDPQNSVRNIPTTSYNASMNVFPPGQRSSTTEDGSPIYYDDGNGNLVDANGVRIDLSQIGQQQIPAMVNGMPTFSENGQMISQNGLMESSMNGFYNGNNSFSNPNYSNEFGNLNSNFMSGEFGQTSNFPTYYGEYPQENHFYQNAPMDNQYSRDYSSGTGTTFPQPGTTPLTPNTRSVLPPKPSTR